MEAAFLGLRYLKLHPHFHLRVHSWFCASTHLCELLEPLGDSAALHSETTICVFEWCSKLHNPLWNWPDARDVFLNCAEINGLFVLSKSLFALCRNAPQKMIQPRGEHDVFGCTDSVWKGTLYTDYMFLFSFDALFWKARMCRNHTDPLLLHLAAAPVCTWSENPLLSPPPPSWIAHALLDLSALSGLIW